MPVIVVYQEDRFSESFILWASLIVSAWLFLVYFPGIFFIDSFIRWQTCSQLVSMGGCSKYLDTALPSLWMGLTYLMTGSKAAITFLQSFLFFFSSLFLIKNVGNFKGGWMLIPSALFLSFPLFQGYSVFNEPCIGTVIGLNFFFCLLFHKDGFKSRLESGVYLFLYFFVFSTIFGFRLNTITILPVVFFVLWQRFQFKKTILVPFVSLVMALVFVFSLPYVLTKWRHVKRQDLIAVGLAWETVQIIKRTHAPQYDRYLDYAGTVKGATRNAMANVEESEWMGFLGPNSLCFESIVTPDVSRRIKKDYWRLICAHPGEFAKNKIYIFGRVLGIFKPLKFLEFLPDLEEKLMQPGFRSTPLRNKKIDDLNLFMEQRDFLMRPFLMFLTGLLCLVFSRSYLRKEVYFTGVIYSLALFYYAAFFITTQSFEFRYFFPSFFLIAIMFVVIVAKTIELLATRHNVARNVASE